MASRSGVRIELDAAALPALPGALELAEAGVRTGGDRRNRDYAGPTSRARAAAAHEALAFDPQTAGGLLVSLPARQARSCSRRPSPQPGCRLFRSVGVRGGGASRCGEPRTLEASRERLPSEPRGLAAPLRPARGRRPSRSLWLRRHARAPSSGSRRSGLGCDNWPRCGDDAVPDARDATRSIEFGNRLVALVGIVARARHLARRATGRRASRAGPRTSRSPRSRDARPDPARRRHGPPRPPPARGDVPLPARARRRSRCRSWSRSRPGATRPASRRRSSPRWLRIVAVGRRRRLRRARRHGRGRDGVGAALRAPTGRQPPRARDHATPSTSTCAPRRCSGSASSSSADFLWRCGASCPGSSRLGAVLLVVLVARWSSARSSTGTRFRGGSCSCTSPSRRRSGRSRWRRVHALAASARARRAVDRAAWRTRRPAAAR